MPEESRFIRGMRSWIGLKQIGVEYERDERHAGDSKYGLKQLVSLALNGIFNFSEYPIKFISWLGGMTMIVSSLYLLFALVKRFITDAVPDGFTALLFVIILFGGIQLLAIGVIGEYIVRIFFQVKKRPLFVVSNVIRNGEIESDE
jgi:dolichol-phosphate mannosyltransferase